MTAVLVAHNLAFPRGQITAAYSQGGGIANLAQARLTIAQSTIADNGAWGDFYPDSQGGGIYNGGALQIQQSRIARNPTSGEGGGIFGGDYYRDVLIEKNWAGYQGGGLYGLGNLINVTIRDNAVGEAGQGGGGCGTLVNVTISHNHADNFGSGGGLGFDERREEFTGLQIGNTVIVHNDSSNNCNLSAATTWMI